MRNLHCRMPILGGAVIDNSTRFLLGALQIVSVGVGCISGVGAIFFETREKTGKLSDWGKWSLRFVVISAMLSIALEIGKQYSDYEHSMAEAVEKQKGIDNQNEITTKLLSELNRVRTSFRSLSVNLRMEYESGQMPSPLMALAKPTSGWRAGQTNLSIDTKTIAKLALGSVSLTVVDQSDKAQVMELSCSADQAKCILGIWTPYPYRVNMIRIGAFSDTGLNWPLDEPPILASTNFLSKAGLHSAESRSYLRGVLFGTNKTPPTLQISDPYYKSVFDLVLPRTYVGAWPDWFEPGGIPYKAFRPIHLDLNDLRARPKFASLNFTSFLDFEHAFLKLDGDIGEHCVQVEIISDTGQTAIATEKKKLSDGRWEFSGITIRR